ncbi:MAG: NAD(P)/FAD-dependent oxidoreductase, partial [Sinobacteraceae bacterium]|nr:NAD(P)/FAD-dependent oxidoreductase [Nevskiaceae bacterium]
IVIGAGMGGLNAAVMLKEAGIAFTVVEKNVAVGGTWLDNAYPGARLDTPSRTYTHVYGIDFDWHSAFSPQQDNLRYLEWIADKYNLRSHISFNTEVTSVIWDEAGAMWELTVRTDKGTRKFRANVVISACGLFSRAHIPSLQGLDRFQGQWFHTSRWPKNLVTDDKRVAVIGTGATGYQMIPELARHAGHLTVFQRTPQWTVPVPGYTSAFPPAVKWLDRHFPFHRHFMHLRSAWLNGPRERARLSDIDPNWHDPHTRSPVNKVMRDACVAFIQRKLAERPEFVEKMIPKHPFLSARPIIVDPEYGIYDALLRDNVTLVTEGIERITEHGIVSMDGTEHKLDVIVFATGFKANEFLWPMEVRGRGGQRVEDLWAKDGARAYLGTMLPGFPNFFMIYGPNTNPFGGVSVVNREELTVRYALECIGYLLQEGKRSIEPRPESYWAYNSEVDRWEKRKIYTDARAHSYYTTQFGRSAVNCPIPGQLVWALLRTLNFDELRVE